MRCKACDVSYEGRQEYANEEEEYVSSGMCGKCTTISKDSFPMGAWIQPDASEGVTEIPVGEE